MKPVVSVCIPAYRQPEMLVRAVRSVLMQKGCLFEIVITDDSEDDCVETALAEFLFDSRIRYFRNPVRLGAIHNWNNSISKSTADIVKILHHDDWFNTDNGLSLIIQPILLGNATVVFSACRAMSVNGREMFVHCASQDQIASLEIDPMVLGFANFIGAPSVVSFLRSLAVSFDASYIWLSDVDFYVRLLSAAGSNMHYIREPLINITADAKTQLSRECEVQRLRSTKEYVLLFASHKFNRLEPTRIAAQFLLLGRNISLIEMFQAVCFTLSLLELRIAGNLLIGNMVTKPMDSVSLFLTRLWTRNGRDIQVSYSQCGEDMIVDFLLLWLGISHVTYLDLGANDPVRFNNTYRFYKKGFKGVLVEPDEQLSQSIRKKRPRDVCVASAVGTTYDTEVSFFKMSADTLSTTKIETVELYENRLAAEIKVPQLHINVLLEKYFPDNCPIYVSLDVEGLDFQLLSSWNFSRWRPVIICVETLTYSQNKTATKVQEIFNLMTENNYFRYADTYINTIFVRRDNWDCRIG
jgi:glycosyltransferase involved in cell wall biosynthesis